MTATARDRISSRSPPPIASQARSPRFVITGGEIYRRVNMNRDLMNRQTAVLTEVDGPAQRGDLSDVPVSFEDRYIEAFLGQDVCQQRADEACPDDCDITFG